MKKYFNLPFIFLFVFILLPKLLTDGGFVWTGYKRLREPDQKAILVYENGVEDLFLKVKYEGNISEFGWIVPFPTQPEVRKVTFSCFHLLDLRWKIGKKLYNTPMDLIKYAMLAQYQSLGGGIGEGGIGDVRTLLLLSK